MPRLSLSKRLSRLSLADWALLVEALPTLALASLAIEILPFRRVAAAATSWGKGGTRRDDERVKKVRWAVQAWSRRVPWKAVCFQQGLTLHLMLRRRGIGSVLNYGVAQLEEKGLSAHVWVEVDGETVIGGEEAPKFACLARFPARAA